MRRYILYILLWVAIVPAKAENAYLDSLRLVVDTTSSDSVRARTYILLAEGLQYSDLQKSISLCREADRVSREIGDGWATAKANAILGSVYVKLGAFDRGARLLYDSKAIFLALDDTLELARISIAIGLMQNANKENARALESYQAAEKYYGMVNRRKGMAIARHNAAGIYEAMGQRDKALKIYRENLVMDPPPAPVMVAATCNNLGNMFVKERQLDSAIVYFQRAVRIKRELGYSGSLANTYNNIAEVYILQKKFQMASLFLDSAGTWANNSGDVNVILENLRYKSTLAHETGDDAEAFQTLTSYLTLKDSVFNEQRAEQITQLNTAYDAESKQAEIDLLQKGSQVAAAEKNRLYWISIALTVGFALLALVLVMSIRRSRERTRTSRELLAKNREIERQREEILVQNRELSHQNQRLADLNLEKDGLIGVVAHDIRAPLNRSAALAELIAAVGPLNEEQRKFADMIGRVSEEGGRLIQDLLELNAYERKDARIDFLETDINELLTRCANGFYSQAASKDITLHLELSTVQIFARTDEKLLSRVLDNLVSNAIKFTHPGKNIFLSVKRSDSGLHLHVQDEGQGLSKEDRKKMFRKFQRLTARPTGGESSTGLGLSIVKTLVERLHGEVKVESEVGVGTTFTVSLPLMEEIHRILISDQAG